MIQKAIFLSIMLLPTVLFGQKDQTTSAKKISYLQAINKLETLMNKSPEKVLDHKDYIIGMMAKDIELNTELTEKLMKTPGRSDVERKKIQDQLARTAKQKYVKKNFEQLKWQDEELDKKLALTLVRNFMEVAN